MRLDSMPDSSHRGDRFVPEVWRVRRQHKIGKTKKLKYTS